MLDEGAYKVIRDRMLARPSLATRLWCKYAKPTPVEFNTHVLRDFHKEVKKYSAVQMEAMLSPKAN